MQFPASDKLASTPFAANPPTGIAISIPSGIYSSSSIGLDYTDSPATLQPSSPSFTIPLDSVPTTPQTSSTPHLDTPLPPPLTHLPPLAPEPATLVSPASLDMSPTSALDMSPTLSQSLDMSLATVQSPPCMVTRSQTNSLHPKPFLDYKLYSSTKYHLLALTYITLLAEPITYHQAVKDPYWLDAMKVEFHALMSNHTWTLCLRPVNKKVIRNK
jgi:hypothetical protein